ncbi:hypothetical protein FACS1894217_10960 [Clostridia bacterium]|nr:hypothetical protein FACS1894217_10960 [Clostridia bacterium]
MPKYTSIKTKSFRKSYEKMERQGKNMTLLIDVLHLLENGEKLPPHYRDHALVGNMAGLRECHIQGDWLLVYKIDKGELRLYLMYTGSHSEVL